MTEARDREQLGHALEQPEHDALEVGDRMHSGGVGRLGSRFFGPVLNQAKARQASPTRKAAMPCFTWWWLDPASCPGKNDGSEPAGSTQ